MNHFGKIREQLDRYGVDAMLLTNEANRFYASGFRSSGTDGVALVTRDKAYYWTDSRYIEAAERAVADAEVGLASLGRGYSVLINEAVARHGLKTIGFEDEYMTVAELRQYQSRVRADFKPATELMARLRMVKDAEEIEALIGAQRIAERALEEI